MSENTIVCGVVGDQGVGKTCLLQTYTRIFTLPSCHRATTVAPNHQNMIIATQCPNWLLVTHTKDKRTQQSNKQRQQHMLEYTYCSVCWILYCIIVATKGQLTHQLMQLNSEQTTSSDTRLLCIYLRSNIDSNKTLDRVYFLISKIRYPKSRINSNPYTDNLGELFLLISLPRLFVTPTALTCKSLEGSTHCGCGTLQAQMSLASYEASATRTPTFSSFATALQSLPQPTMLCGSGSLK